MEVHVLIYPHLGVKRRKSTITRTVHHTLLSYKVHSKARQKTSHFYLLQRNKCVFEYFTVIFTDRAGKRNAIGFVRLSVRPFVSTLSLNRLSFELGYLCVRGHDHSSPGIESQGQWSRSKVNVHKIVNAV